MSSLINPSRKVGRPATYANAADRARAWRERQRNLLEQAKKQTTLPSESHSMAEEVFAALRSEFDLYGGEDKSRKLRSNSANAANTVRTILAIMKYNNPTPSPHQSTLAAMVDFFDEVNTFCDREFKVRKRQS